MYRGCKINEEVAKKFNEQLKRGEYNPNVDYVEAVNRYNQLVSEGKQTEAKALLKEYGGLIKLLANQWEQRVTRNGEIPKLVE